MSVQVSVFWPIILPAELLRVLVPSIIPIMDVRTSVFPMAPQALVMLSHDLGLRERGKRIQMTGHSASGNLNHLGTSSNSTWVYADTASLASPAQSGSREVASRNLAGVLFDAEEPCPVITAWEPESSFTASPRNKTRPSYFRNLLAVFFLSVLDYFGFLSSWHFFHLPQSLSTATVASGMFTTLRMGVGIWSNL